MRDLERIVQIKRVEDSILEPTAVVEKPKGSVNKSKIQVVSNVVVEFEELIYTNEKIYSYSSSDKGQ